MLRIAFLLAFAAYLPPLHAQTASPDAGPAGTARTDVVKQPAGFAADTAATGKRRDFLAFNFGNSLAVGKFRKNEDPDLGDGFAQNGFAFQLEYAGFWNRNIGFGFSGGTFANKLDERRASAFFPIEDQSNPNATQSVTELKPWRTYHLLVGPYLTFPFENLSLDFKFLGGLVANRNPGGLHTTVERITGGRETITILEISPRTNTAAGYNLGVGLRLKLSEGTQLKVGADYIYSFPQATYAFGPRTNTPRVTTPVKAGRQSLSVVNFSWGLAINVGGRK